jgi:hypothetical protein
MIGSANAITPSNSPERRERYLGVSYPRLDRAQDHSGPRSSSWGVVRLFSIATMVTVSSRPRPAILEEEVIWAPSFQAIDGELFTSNRVAAPADSPIAFGP